MRVPLRRGRFPTPADSMQKIRALWSPVTTQLSLAEKERRAVPEPVVVNDQFVSRFFPGEDPIGKRFCIDPTNKTYWFEIVEVVGDMHRQGLERRTVPEYFGPYVPAPNGRVDLLVRTRAEPLALAAAVRQETRAKPTDDSAYKHTFSRHNRELGAKLEVLHAVREGPAVPGFEHRLMRGCIPAGRQPRQIEPV